MASITFTDSTGAATLQPYSGNASRAVASKLRGWRPDSAPVGDYATRLGSGARDFFEFREAARVTFTMEGIANDDMAILDRFLLHLRRGGTFTLNTTDLSSRSYSDMALADGTEPEVGGPDPRTLDYSLTMTAEYVGSGTPSRMVCIYN